MKIIYVEDKYLNMYVKINEIYFECRTEQFSNFVLFLNFLDTR